MKKKMHSASKEAKQQKTNKSVEKKVHHIIYMITPTPGIEQISSQQGVSKISSSSNHAPELFDFMQSISTNMKETIAQLATISRTVTSFQSELQELRRRID
jgi:chromosome segregation ATPase